MCSVLWAPGAAGTLLSWGLPQARVGSGGQAPRVPRRETWDSWAQLGTGSPGSLVLSILSPRSAPRRHSETHVGGQLRGVRLSEKDTQLPEVTQVTQVPVPRSGGLPCLQRTQETGAEGLRGERPDGP